ncbi:formyltetrahydrofolate deformylase [Nocardioides sp. Kera G14]|uniref:formyltetrahydrofolate deformylase n=1 Tax=Nocardioides sp. Kera G14 TaxID=2884264 RepID=UPI001D11A2F4|nr:formyltetrahydrofolate deformylase [Nocardioides sp. Kera G14]UDY24669.1 formyltetrahydrofolate deformylase [Nocardioides sp. Kera G14]
MTRPEFVLTIDCPDAPGLVHAVSGFLVARSGNIIEAQQFNDPNSGRFFQRVHFEVLDDTVTLADLSEGFAAVADHFSMAWELRDAVTPYRTLLMVSREGHCLNDLLFRWSTGALPIEIPAIVGNHLDLKPLADHYGIDFHHIPVTAATKADAEAQLMELVDGLGIDLVVLARYMQILSDDLCGRLAGRAINIHHSFLPSFKGARPYHQAWARGVKLVGATAHYVTAELDEGPIIEQDVLRVDHRTNASDIVAAGKDVEAQVLSRAVKWHAQTRILLNGHRTVVFH